LNGRVGTYSSQLCGLRRDAFSAAIAQQQHGV